MGQLYIIEIVLTFIAAHELLGRRMSDIPLRVRKPLLFSCLWFFAQLASDLWNHSTLDASMRGLASIFFLTTDIVGLSFVLRRGRKTRAPVTAMLGAVSGLVLSGALGFALEPNLYARENPWKFGFAVPAALLVSLLVGTTSRSTEARRFLAPTAFGALALLNYSVGYRSMAGICAFAAIVMAAALFKRNGNGRRLSKPVLVLLSLTIGALAVLISTAYEHAAVNGHFGLAAQQKAIVQNQGRFGGLLGGRPEILFNVSGILRSPLIGNGSYAQLHGLTESRALQSLYDLGYVELASQISQSPLGLVSHSYLFGAWVDAGVLGALFWLSFLNVGRLALKMVLRRANLPGSAAIVAFLAAYHFWSIFFSPFGAESRFLAAVTLVIFAVSYDERLDTHDSTRHHHSHY